MHPEDDVASYAARFESLFGEEIGLADVLSADTALRAAIEDAKRANSVGDLFTTRLRRGAADPARYNLETMRAAALREPAWAFWVKWYEGFLGGRPLDWELQERTAVGSNSAEQIEEIEAQFVAQKLPLAERIVFDADISAFRREPTALQNPALIEATLKVLADAWEDVLARPGNGLSESSREAGLIDRTLRKYRNDPQVIELNLTDLHRSLVRQMLETEELPASEENLALQNAAEQGARAVRANHPEISDNRNALGAVVWREMRDEDKERLRPALPVLQAISDKEMSDDWGQDVPRLLNDAVAPPGSNAPPLPGADAATRIFSRAAKMSLAARSADVAERLYSHPAQKMAAVLSAGRTIVDFLVWLVRLGIGLLS